MGRSHRYKLRMTWTGNQGEGTKTYKSYARDHVYDGDGKPSIPGSADPHFLGDATRWNPEELLVASISSCHQLWYLHLCAVNGVVVESYVDEAEGEMVEDENGGHFTSVTLHPKITISSDNAELARKLHHDAHKKCFIANSVNFPVTCEPDISQN